MSKQGGQRSPNFVLFNPDQWRGDVLGHRGNPAAVTPVLDRMVRDDAVSFASAFVQNPVCTPSRCSFMTGWYPHVRGHRTMHHMLKADEPNILRSLRNAGYHVWWGGKNDLVPAQDGFSDTCDVKNQVPEGTLPMYGPRRQAGSDSDFYGFQIGRLDVPEGADHYPDSDWAHVNAAIDYIHERAATQQPFCIYLPLTYPHPPYAVEEPWYSTVERSRLPDRVTSPGWGSKPSVLAAIRSGQGVDDWPEEKWDALRATYYGMCARVDHQLGLLLDALRSTSQYDDTAVIVLSDHGDFTGDYGLVEKTQNTFEDCLTNVPLVIKPPSWQPVAPGTRDDLVELVDVPATIEDLAGLVPEHTHFGRSLVPLVAGGDHQPHRDAVFCEGGRLADEQHAMELESTPAGFDGAESRYWPRLSAQRSIPEHTKAAMCRTHDYKYVRRLYESDELYDLRTDPHELVNRIDDPELNAVRHQLIDRLLAWYQETCDVVPHRSDQR